MDVTRFINSKSVAKYLNDINYKFSAQEAAYLVWQCKTASLNEKFSAWEEIINTMPDMPVKKRRWGWVTDEPSLHAFLKKYIQYYKKKLIAFIMIVTLYSRTVYSSTVIWIGAGTTAFLPL